MKPGLWITICLFTCLDMANQAHAQHHGRALADSAISVVSALQEVRSLEDKLAPQERISIQVRHSPGNRRHYYCVQVGISSPLRLTPVYNFAVYPKDMSVGYINTLLDTIIALQVWQKDTGTSRKN